MTLTYQAPVRDIQFVLNELLELPRVLGGADGGDFDPEVTGQILDAAATFAEDIVAPLNTSGDRQGCKMPSAGVVTTPDGFKRAYEQFVEGGWPALACQPAHGGQGMPTVLNNALFEIFCGANMGWAAYPGMSHAAYTCLAANGSQEQMDTYLPHIASGSWAGTMCLTEPHSGTDLGLLRTRAAPRADGSYEITGTKIFISGGEQDLTSNIVHLVLARLADAPPGVKGISLFIVPKYLVASDGEPAVRNAVQCGSIEHKMGIHANATCTMNFDGAQGWLLGEANKGLASMFVMMNHARIIVGVNAIGLMDAAYQKALAYAKDRAQGRAPSVDRGGAPADPIIHHPDVRRMLLTQKAYVEGSRAYALWASHLIDLQHRGDTAEARLAAADMLAVATPIVKAFSSDLAVDCTSMAMQVFGGHGYICDNGVEQHLRDARIIPLYEGSNGVQAMDLLGRKVLADGTGKFAVYLASITEFAESRTHVEGMQSFASTLGEVAALALRTARHLSLRAETNPNEVGVAAAPFLRLAGLVSLAWMWARMAELGLSNAHRGDAIYAGKIATARFYFEKLLPEVRSLAEAIAAGSGAVMDTEIAWL